MEVGAVEAVALDLMRPGTPFGFKFGFGQRDHPESQVSARFTDDAGLHWQIDNDLHLAKLDNRDW
jgi:hypothetical protein